VTINICTSFYEQCLAAFSNEAHSPNLSAIIKILIYFHPSDRILRITTNKQKFLIIFTYILAVTRVKFIEVTDHTWLGAVTHGSVCKLNLLEMKKYSSVIYWKRRCRKT